MDEKEKIEDQEYKKRIKELVDRLEKGKNTDTSEVYRELLEGIEYTKQIAITNINLKYLNDRSLMGFIILIQEYYNLREDAKSPFGRDQFQEEIEILYELINIELKKSNPFIYHSNPKVKEKLEARYKKRILTRMKELLGSENVKQFIDKFNIPYSIGLNSIMNEIKFACICSVGLILLFLFALFLSRI